MCRGLNNRVEDITLQRYAMLQCMNLYFGLQNKPTRAKKKDDYISGLMHVCMKHKINDRC